MRQKHKKSRFGCKECKQRHLKCDESRPSCLNCHRTSRPCSFTTLLPSTRNPLNAILCDAPTPKSDATGSTTDPIASPAVSIPPSSAKTDSGYTLSHLELLDHAQNELFASLSSPAYAYKVSVKEAFTTPYLMDQLLCLAAAHKSTVVESERQVFYLSEAARLQSRALSGFNSCKDLGSEEKCVPVFLFSTFLGLYHMFHSLSSREDLSSILDKLVQCLNIYRGVCLVAAQPWPLIQARLGREFFGDVPLIMSMDDFATDIDSQNECVALRQFISNGELESPARKAYYDALSVMQKIFDTLRQPDLSEHRRIALVQEWTVRVSAEFITCLGRRCPEALVVLAYYAVLIHRARRYWVYGDSGQFLIRMITAHLGPYWAEWLQWPNHMCQLK